MPACTQRDQRRRRLLTDERVERPDSGSWPQDTPASHRWEWSANGPSFLEHQVRCLDLIPRRWVALVLLWLAGSAVIVGLEAAYFEFARRAAVSGATMVTALDLGAKGSLACWFSSLLLLAAFAVALIVYSVRKHRADDYEGRYRIWLWAAGCWLLAATDQAASLRQALCEALIALGGPRMVGDGSLWLGAACLLALGAVGARLVADMRGCRLSIAALLAAAAAHSAAAASRLGWVPLGQWDVMVRAGAEMAGNGLLLGAMTLHARWLILDAEDELSGAQRMRVRRRKKKPINQRHPWPGETNGKGASIPSTPAPRRSFRVRRRPRRRRRSCRATRLPPFPRSRAS